MGSTKQLPDERWRAFESQGSGVSRVTANATRPTKRAAQRAARDRLDEKLKKRPKRDHRGESFKQLADDYEELEAPSLALTTANRYASILKRHLVPYFGKDVAAEIYPTDLLRYKASKRKTGLAPLTIEHHMSLLRTVFSFGVRTRRLDFNAAESVKERKKPKVKHKRRALTASEAKKLLAAALAARDVVPKRKGGERDDLYLPILLALSAGLRRGEICGLLRKDIDLEAGVLSLRHALVKVPKTLATLKDTKSDAEEVRLVLLPQITVDALKAEYARQATIKLKGRKWNPRRLVLPNKRGEWRLPDTLGRHVSQLLAACEIPDADLHTLRHTHSTLLREAGIDPLTIRDRQGHADLATTEGYMHATIDVQRPAAASLQAALA